MTTHHPRLAVVSTMTGVAWGGSEELWAAAARSATEKGWQVLASVVDASARQHEALRSDGVDVREHVVSFPWSARVELQAARVRSTLRHVEAFRPDVVLVSQGAAYDLVARPVLWRALHSPSLRNVPLVVVCQLNHDEPPHEAWRQRARELFDRATAILFVADRNRRQAERHLALRLPEAAVIRNPVNLANFEAVPLPEPGQTARLACVARFDAQFKGQDLLLEALAGEPWKNRDWRLSLYGRGKDERYLRDLVDHYGLAHRVAFCGHVDNVRGIWASEEILVLGSRAEGTPLALVEAMVCGRPAVVTRVAGNDEWITDDHTGFVAEAPSVESISDALERAWAGRPSWAEMGRHARHAALGRIDPSPGDTLLGVLADAAQRHQGQGAMGTSTDGGASAP